VQICQGTSLPWSRATFVSLAGSGRPTTAGRLAEKWIPNHCIIHIGRAFKRENARHQAVRIQVELMLLIWARDTFQDMNQTPRIVKRASAFAQLPPPTNVDTLFCDTSYTFHATVDMPNGPAHNSTPPWICTMGRSSAIHKVRYIPSSISASHDSRKQIRLKVNQQLLGAA
jgi:hypothetical protein